LHCWGRIDVHSELFEPAGWVANIKENLLTKVSVVVRLLAFIIFPPYNQDIFGTRDAYLRLERLNYLKCMDLILRELVTVQNAGGQLIQCGDGRCRLVVPFMHLSLTDRKEQESLCMCMSMSCMQCMYRRQEGGLKSACSMEAIQGIVSVTEVSMSDYLTISCACQCRSTLHCNVVTCHCIECLNFYQSLK
jgi:hypothetical protein